MYEMFVDCSSLKTLDLSTFDASSAENMEVMFWGCGNLTTIKTPKNITTDYAQTETYEKYTWINSKGKVVDNMPKNSASVTLTRKLEGRGSTITLSKTSVVYTGKAIKPAVTVKDYDDNKINAKNYTVTYKNNTKVGTATVTVTFKGDYAGTVKTTFTIVPKATTLSKVTSAKTKTLAVTWKKQATQTTGYQIQYSTSSKFTTKTTKTVTIKGTKTLSKTISKLTAKKKYYVRVRTYTTVSKKNYYSAWSKAVSATTK
jgi:surface protein